MPDSKTYPPEMRLLSQIALPVVRGVYHLGLHVAQRLHARP